MRTLYFTVSVILLVITELGIAATKIEAIDDVILTSCLTTRIKFNQEALKPYQATALTLKIEDEANETSYSEPVNFQKGVFSWEKAIPMAENLTFTLLKGNTPISYPFSKEIRTQLVSIIAPAQIAQADIEESGLIRGLPIAANKKDLPIAVPKELMNKELLVIVSSTEGKLLWQHYGKADSKGLTAKIPADASYNAPRVILSNTICDK
jgi:hypothetical protein